MKPYKRPQHHPVKQYPEQKQIACASCSADEVRIVYDADLKPKKKKKKEGFSFIELMCCLAIIGILSSLAVPSYMKRLEGKRKLACIENTKTLNDAVKDVFLQHEAQEMLFSELGTNAYQEVQDLLVDGFENCEVVGYSFHPEVLNDCYYSIVSFKGVSAWRLYHKY